MVKQKIKNSVMKIRYSFSGIALLICLLSSSLSAKNNVEFIKCNPKAKTSFAIFVDKKTFDACKDEILKYRDVLQAEGLGTYIIASDWKTPEEVKNEIIKLSKLKPALEGMIFVGDIPIVRVRKGQHLTTAFKMNENTFPMVESSVTSDRYYDDLDLKFEYIGKDGANDHYFYYNLKGDSKQVITPDFYSARVVAPKSLGDKYELIKKFFTKTVAAHKENNELDKFTYFAGHGYNSDCMTTWRNQTAVFKEHFPLAYTNGFGNKFLNFRQDPYMKYTLYSEMQRPDLDAFLFYEHGAYNIQYINGEYAAQNLEQNIKSLKSALRDKYRKLNGEKAEKFAEEACSKYGFTKEIFNTEVLAATSKEDSTANVDINISLEDLSKLKTGARFTMLNACYNGSFHQDDYVAGYHIFNDGRTVVAQGNTVNVLQDKYADELIGYLSLGIRVGFWQKEVITLESHLIGDPTFRFSTKEANSFNTDLVLRQNAVEHWNSLLQDKRGIVRAMALKQLSKIQPSGFSDQAFTIFSNDPSKIVRMQALKALMVKPDQNLTKAVAKGMFDPYEMLRRTSAHMAGEIGDPSLIQPLVEISLFDSESQRVSYAAQSSLQVFELEKVLAEYKKQIKESSSVEVSKLESVIEEDIASRQKSLEKQLTSILSKDIPIAARENAIRSLRNYQQHSCLDKLLGVLKDAEQQKEVRLLLCEALGWFNCSTGKEEIIMACNQVLAQPSVDPEIREEAIKTINRLQ